MVHWNRAPDCLPATGQSLWTLVFLLTMLFSGPSCSPTAFQGRTHISWILHLTLHLTSYFQPRASLLCQGMMVHEWWWDREDQDAFMTHSASHGFLGFPSTFCHRYCGGFFSFFPPQNTISSRKRLLLPLPKILSQWYLKCRISFPQHVVIFLLRKQPDNICKMLESHFQRNWWSIFPSSVLWYSAGSGRALSWVLPLSNRSSLLLLEITTDSFVSSAKGWWVERSRCLAEGGS